MADRPGSLESVGRVSNGRHPRLMSCDECPRWTRSPSFSSFCPPVPLPRTFLCPSFFRTRAFRSRALPSARPFCDPSVAVHPAFSYKRESRMTETRPSLSPFRSANRKLETSDRAPATAAATIKRYVPPLSASEPARKIFRSVVDPRGTVTRSLGLYALRRSVDLCNLVSPRSLMLRFDSNFALVDFRN